MANPAKPSLPQFDPAYDEYKMRTLVDELNRYVEQLQGKITELDTQIAALDARVTALEP